MTLQDHLRVLREQWLVMAMAVLLGLVGAAALFFVRPPEYTAKLTMYVSAQAGESTSAAFEGAQLSQERVTSYVQLVNSHRVAQDVVDRLRLPMTAEELAARVTASSALDSVLIDVAVTGTSADSAATIANTVGAVFVDLVDEIERPVRPDQAQPVVVRVVQPAAAPDHPSSLGLPVLLALGLLAGLVVGVAGALARNALDVSVKSPDHLRAAAAAPNLGTIAHDPAVPDRPLTVHDDPRSPRAEEFRQLRTNLQFVDVDRPRKVFLVTSSLPEEGKTTTATNLAIALALAGSRVLLIEGDLRRPKVADLLGLERAIGLTNVLSGGLTAEQVIQPWSGGLLDVIASGPLPPNPSELLASGNMNALLGQLRKRYDVVLLDSPPLLPVTDAAAVAPATDGAILVCRFKKTQRNQVEMAASALAAVSAPLLGTVFTMVPSTGRRSYARYHDLYQANATEMAAVQPRPRPAPPRSSPRSGQPLGSQARNGHRAASRGGVG